jgi:hypothetical protein
MRKYIRGLIFGTSIFAVMVAFQNCGKGFSSSRGITENSSLWTSSSDNASDSAPTGSEPMDSAPDSPTSPLVLPPPDSSKLPAVDPIVQPVADDSSPTPVSSDPVSIPATDSTTSSGTDGLTGTSPEFSDAIGAPAFYTDYTLHDTSVYLGDPFSLAARASGSGVTYRWYKDGAPIISDRTGFEYSKARAEYADAGIYKVVATNTKGSASVSATLKVLAPVAPIFVSATYINAYSVYAGDRVLISGGRAVGGDIKYRWYKDNVLISDTSGSHNIAMASASDSGQYRLEAYNSLGVATRTFSLTVLPMEMPKFSGSLVDQAIYAGDFLVINSKGATGGGIKYRWYKDGVVIPDETARSCSKYPAAVSDAGTYKVEAYNAIGSTFLNCAISVTPR